MPADALPDQSGFAVGDAVVLTKGDWTGRVGTIDYPAHPDSPWTWVVTGEGDEGPAHFWGTAVNEDEIALADRSAANDETEETT